MDGTPRYVGTRIGAALAAQGRKRRWLADLLGVSESYLSRVISGERTMPEPMARRTAAALGVDFSLHFELHERSKSLTGAEVAA